MYANPAARWETKYWTEEAWAELADLLIERTGAAVVFSGSPDDASHIRTIAERMKQRPIIAAGRLNLAEAVALIEAADVYVGVDSGPMHIAAFAGDTGGRFVRPHRSGKGGTVRGGASRDPPH